MIAAGDRLGPLFLLLLLGLGAATEVFAQSASGTLFAWDEVVEGDRDTKLRWPVAIASVAVDEMAIVEAAGARLLIFRREGATTDWKVAAAVDLPAPAFGLTSCGERYVVSLRRPGGLVTLQDPAFELIPLALPAEVTPGAVACDADGDILVGDLAGERILTLSETGKILSDFSVGEAVAALEAGAGRSVYAVLRDSAEIRRFGPTGETLARIEVPGVSPVPAWPSGLILESNGEIVVADRHGGRLLVFETDGRLAGTGSRQGWEPGLLRLPADLTRLADGRVAVADLGNGRIQIFRRTGAGGRP